MLRSSWYTSGAQDAPFSLPGREGSEGCLLVHGSMGTAGDMRFLGELLHAGGFAVEGVSLPGHRRRPPELEGVDWRVCYEVVREAWRDLAARGARVHVIGFSFGAALAVHLAVREPVHSLVLLAPALHAHLGPRAILNLTRAAVPGTPIATYLRWYLGLARFFRLVRAELPQVSCPLLAIHARDDETIRVMSSLAVFDRVASAERHLLLLASGGHALPNGIVREQIGAEIVRHLEAQGGRTGERVG